MKSCRIRSRRIKLALILVLLSGECFAGVPRAENQPLKIGVILPLTGQVAGMGIAFRNGIDLFLEQRQVPAGAQFLYEDSGYDGKRAVTALHKLRSADKADLVIVWGNTPSGACAPVAERLQAPLIAVTMNPDARGRRYVVTFGSTAEALVDKIVAQLRAWQALHPAAVSVDIGNALTGVALVKAGLNGNLMVREVANDESDFKTVLFGLRRRHADALVLFALPEQALTLMRQAVELGLQTKIIGGDFFADEEFQRRLGNQLPEVAFVYGGVRDDFIAALRARFGGVSYFYESACGYALAALSAELSARRGPGEPHELFEELTALPMPAAPIIGLKLVKDEQRGRHFENEGRIYRHTDLLK
jgi:branched-chain amino acid transport system substrate-binding protein